MLRLSHQPVRAGEPADRARMRDGSGGRAEPGPAAPRGAEGFVVLRLGFEPTRETALSILRFVRAHSSPFKRVRRLEFAELPKTVSGKIRRVELRGIESQRSLEMRRPQEFWEDDFADWAGNRADGGVRATMPTFAKLTRPKTIGYYGGSVCSSSRTGPRSAVRLALRSARRRQVDAARKLYRRTEVSRRLVSPGCGRRRRRHVLLLPGAIGPGRRKRSAAAEVRARTSGRPRRLRSSLLSPILRAADAVDPGHLSRAARRLAVHEALTAGRRGAEGSNIIVISRGGPPRRFARHNLAESWRRSTATSCAPHWRRHAPSQRCVTISTKPPSLASTSCRAAGPPVWRSRWSAKSRFAAAGFRARQAGTEELFEFFAIQVFDRSRRRCSISCNSLRCCRR